MLQPARPRREPDLKVGSLAAWVISGAGTVDGTDVPADGDPLAFVDVDSARWRPLGATKQDTAFAWTRLAEATRRSGGDHAALARESGVPAMIVVRTDPAYRKVRRAAGPIVEVSCTALAARRAPRTFGRLTVCRVDRPAARRVDRPNGTAVARCRGHEFAD